MCRIILHNKLTLKNLRLKESALMVLVSDRLATSVWTKIIAVQIIQKTSKLLWPCAQRASETIFLFSLISIVILFYSLIKTSTSFQCAACLLSLSLRKARTQNQNVFKAYKKKLFNEIKIKCLQKATQNKIKSFNITWKTAAQHPPPSLPPSSRRSF